MADNGKIIQGITEANKNVVKEVKSGLKDAFSPFISEIKAPFQSMVAGINALPGVAITKRLFSAVSKPLVDSFKADKTTSSKEQLAANNQARQDEKNETLLEGIYQGILGLKDGLLDALQKMGTKGMFGLGAVAGLIAAPFALLSGFFTQLGKELAVLKKAGDFIFVKPVKAIATFFTELGTKFKNSKVVGFFDEVVKGVKGFFTSVVKTMTPQAPKGGWLFGIDDALKTRFNNVTNFIKNSKVVNYFDDVAKSVKGYFTGVRASIPDVKAGGLKMISTIGDDLAKTGKSIKDFFKPVYTVIFGSAGGPGGQGATKGIVGFIKGIFNPIKTAIGYIKSTALVVDGFMPGVQAVVNFAKGVGTFLGKIFLPLTILMGAYDAITGFMKGYADEEGNVGEKIFSGLREGLAKVIENLIGLPLDLLKSGLTWLIKTFFGESEVTAALEGFSFKETIGDMVRLPFNLIKGAYNWIKGLFVDPAAALQELWTGIVGDGGLIDLLFTPIDKALKWVMGVFGFSVPLDENGKEYTIMGIIKDALTGIVNFFKSLLDIDVKGVLKSIPGGSFLLSLFEDDTLDEQLEELQKDIAKKQEDVDTDGFFETEYNRQKNIEELKEMQQQLLELQAQKEKMNVINNIDNSTNNSGNYSQQSLSSTQLVDALPAGSKME